MRARFFIQVLSFAVIVTLGVIWLKSRATATNSQARLVALATARHNSTRALGRDRDHLRSALAEAERRQAVNTTAAASQRDQPAPPRVTAPSLVMGKWRFAKEWRNEGQSTAQGAVATLLWASAGGDLATMMRLIVYDEAARKQAQALFDSLPSETRRAFPTPEALVAGLTLEAVPTDGVQLSWFHQRDADHATVGLLFHGPDQSTPMETQTTPAQGEKPPMLVGPNFTQFAALSLDRSPQGWRIAIPAAAVERLARQARMPAN